MKVVFLDFDGVLNNDAQAIRNGKFDTKQAAATMDEANLIRMRWDIAAENIWNLKFVLENVSELKVVLTTAWRKHFDMHLFVQLFQEFGIPEGTIIGQTPVVGFSSGTHNRMHEIDLWRRDIPGLEWSDCLILDDKAIMRLGDPVRVRFIHTDQRLGFTYVNAIDAIQAFRPDWRPPLVQM